MFKKSNVLEKLKAEYSAKKTKLSTLSEDELTAYKYLGYGLDAVDFFKTNTNKELDFSRQSVELVETMINQMHEKMSSSKPSNEQILNFSKLFAGYIGEVARHEDNAKWVSASNTHDKSAGDAIVFKNGNEFYLLNKVIKRFQNGPEDNVWHAYQIASRN